MGMGDRQPTRVRSPDRGPRGHRGLLTGAGAAFPFATGCRPRITLMKTMHWTNGVRRGTMRAEVRMRATWGWAAVLAVGCTAGVAEAQDAPADQAPPEARFLTSLEQGFARARAEKKLLFVDLHHPL